MGMAAGYADVGSQLWEWEWTFMLMETFSSVQRWQRVVPHWMQAS